MAAATPINARGAGETLEEALNKLLHPLDLTWVVPG